MTLCFPFVNILMTLHRVQRIAVYSFIVGLMAVFFGVSFTPSFHSIISIGSNLTQQNLPSHSHWLNQSLLYPALMSILRIDNPSMYLVFTVSFLAAHLIAQFTLIDRFFPDRHEINIYFISSGCLTTAFYWLGYADPTAFLLGTI